MTSVGVVVIGRNEGQRLVRCLERVDPRARIVVYVDSGSTDGSVEAARRLGAHVVPLDMSIPFTAARARNAGLARLRELRPDVEAAQFLDGDCELQAGFLERAAEALRADPTLGAVCGHLRERHPERSFYNRLCDLEWQGPVGEVAACGGNFMGRVAALRGVGGFRDDLIAGEEPELCLRLRRAGWRVSRIDAEMATHDAAMTRFGQWWRRSVRAGYAFAEGAALHGHGPERHWVAETRRILRWGVVVPAVALAAAIPTGGASLLLFGLYPLLAARVYRRTRASGRPRGDALLYAVFTTLGKLPEAQGALRHWRLRLLGKRSALIEYKPAPPARAAA